MSRYRFDAAVIGAGIAGMAAAVTASGLGKRVALVEKGTFGGNCSKDTCLPSKALIEAGLVRNTVLRAQAFGFEPAAGPAATNVLARIRSVIGDVVAKDVPETFESIGIRCFHGQASFIDAHRVTAGDEVLTAANVIIATGTRPLVPGIPGLEGVPYLTNETLYDIESLPRSIIILGGGVDGLEFGSALNNLGVKVTIVDMAPRLLGNIDSEIAVRLADHLQARGITFLTGAKAKEVKRQRGVKLTVETGDGSLREVNAAALLVAPGRKPNLENLALDKAGVKTSPRGIVTDKHLRTSAPNIYACGDIAGPYQLASTAEYQGIIAARNALLPLKQNVDYTHNAYVIFTDPPLGYLGLPEEQARNRFGELAVYRTGYSGMRKAVIEGNAEGLVKIICKKNGKIVGAHLLGEAAPEVIHELQTIATFGKPLHRLASMTHAYPTYAQAIAGRAAQLAYLDRMARNPFVRVFLKLAPGFRNNLVLARQRLAEQPAPTGLARPEEIHVETAKIENDVCLITLPAGITLADETPYLEAALTSTPRPGWVLLDFSGVAAMNGLGASLLVKLQRLLSQSGRNLLACGVSDRLKEVFEITGLSALIPSFASRAEALRSIGPTVHDKAPAETETGPAFDAAPWMPLQKNIRTPQFPPAAINMNVNGRRTTGPAGGFGQLWQKTYQLRMTRPGITPESVITVLKQHFPEFQPGYNRFYVGPDGISPGAVIAIDSSTPGGPVSTGVVVLQADEVSFTFITPQGHPESGWVSFSAFSTDDAVIVQVLGLARASDPVYEGAFRLVGSKMQVRIWTHLLRSLAHYLGAEDDISYEARRIDPHLQWSQASNIWYNAQIRTLLTVPLRLFQRRRHDS